MMQTTTPVEIAALLLIAFGAIILIVGLVMTMKPGNSDSAHVERESKGVILLGPIPIVWGFGAKAQKVICVIAVLAFAVCLILILR